MKKLMLLALLISSVGYAQKLEYGSGGTVYDAQGSKVKPIAVRELMKNNTPALRLYNAGRSKKTFGNLLFYGGFGLAAYNLVYAAYRPIEVSSSGRIDSNKTGPELAIAGGILVLASIPIKIGYPKKIKAALAEYNQGVVAIEAPRPDITLVANAQGVGVTIGF